VLIASPLGAARDVNHEGREAAKKQIFVPSRSSRFSRLIDIDTADR
jgi:hypothetical protein